MAPPGVESFFAAMAAGVMFSETPTFPGAAPPEGHGITMCGPASGDELPPAPAVPAAPPIVAFPAIELPPVGLEPAVPAVPEAAPDWPPAPFIAPPVVALVLPALDPPKAPSAPSSPGASDEPQATSETRRATVTCRMDLSYREPVPAGVAFQVFCRVERDHGTPGGRALEMCGRR